MPGDTTTRSERLGWSPEAALSLVERSNGSEVGTAALAMVEQLVEADVPLEALDLCIVYFSRALDGLSPGQIPPQRLEALDADLAIERSTSPRLAEWLDALRSRASSAEDLDSVIQFLMRARTTWLLAIQPGRDVSR